MGVHKGTDNFKSSRLARMDAMLKRIEAELHKARRRRMVYPDEKTLVMDMADRVGVDRTTLRRNPKYYKTLVEYLERQPGASIRLSDRHGSPKLLRAKLLDTRIEIAELKARGVHSSEETKSRASPFDGHHEESAANSAQAAFSDTVFVLRAVIERLNSDGDVFEVDLVRCEIRDLSASPSRRVLVAGKRVKPFIEAYKKLLAQEGSLTDLKRQC